MNILWLSGFGISSTFPNPICETKIIEELKKNSDIHIDIACDGIVENTPVQDWKHNPIYMMRRIICWPSYNPDVEKACRKELLDLLNTKKYDCLFVPHKPFETVYAACKAKKKYPNIKLYIYALDPIANEIDANNGIGKHLFLLTRMAEERVFKTADHIFHMECNRNKYSGVKYSKYADKFSYLDFPLIESRNDSKTTIDKNVSSIVLLYSGALDDTYRSPEYLLSVFHLVAQKMDVQLHFYAKGNSITKIEKAEEHNPRIKLFGYVSQNELERRIEEADFLISIGNKYSEMLPSKLLKYFMTGKPVIHIKNQEKDSAISYLEKYGLYLVLDENDPIEKSAVKMTQFIQKNSNERLADESIQSLFVHNTPKWNAEQIRKVLFNGQQIS